MIKLQKWLHVRSSTFQQIINFKIKNIDKNSKNELHVQNQLSFDHQRSNKLSILKLKIISKRNPEINTLHVQNQLNFDRQ